MIDQLQAFRTLLADAVADAACLVDRVTITAGRPAAPSGEGQECQTAIYVWGQGIADENQTNDESCVVSSRWEMAYEIWTCYPEDWEDVDDDAHFSAVSCLYDLMSLVWCAVVEAKDSGAFCDNCSYVELAPLEIGFRSGGAVSALGSVVLPFYCPTPAESPSSP